MSWLCECVFRSVFAIESQVHRARKARFSINVEFETRALSHILKLIFFTLLFAKWIKSLVWRDIEIKDEKAQMWAQ